MFIRIEGSSSVPIYRQIIDQIRDQVASGALKIDEQMPSVRALAAELAVNQNTVLKVYNELCREGVLRMERGSGTFVAETSETKQIEEREWIIASMLAETVEKAKSYRIGPAKMRELLEEQLKKRHLKEQS